MRGDVAAAARAAGMTEEEVATGLWPAVEEFLAMHAGEWALARVYLMKVCGRYLHLAYISVYSRLQYIADIPLYGRQYM